MASTDSNGIMRVDANDDVSPLFPVFNSLAQSVSNAFDANTRIWPVANEAGRTAKVTEIGIGNISSAKPLFVWRANAATGRNLEYTVNGSVWFYYDSSADTSSAKTWRVANVAGRTNIFTAVGPGSTANPVMVWRADAPAGRQLEYNVTSNNATANWHYVPTSQDDTGWVNCTIDGAGWVNAETVQVRNKGGIVYVRGSVHNSTATPNTFHNIGSVPAGFIPARRTAFSATLNTSANLFIRIETSGAINAGWYTSTTATSTASWYGFSAVTYPLG